MNYKVIKDFQFVKADKKIEYLKAGSVLVPDPNSSKYLFKIGGKEFLFDNDLIKNNPDFFAVIDWREDLLIEMKKSKMKTISPLFKVVTGFLDKNLFNSNTLVPKEYLEILAKACYDGFKRTNDPNFLEPLLHLGYEYNDETYWLKK